MDLLALPDKFRGTATAAEVAAAIGRAASGAGWGYDSLPIADGGEGLLACFGGPNQRTEVAGPLGVPVLAGWRLDGTRAVIEMAAASGLQLTDGANDPLAATTAGTGQLVAAAITAGARHIIVGVGGSASTDGGQGAIEMLRGHGPLDGSRGYDVVVAADVTAPFLDAATLFAPQKGATTAQVAELTARLGHLAAEYRDRFGVDVTTLPGAGAAGGLAGGLAAFGARIRPGFAIVADELQLSGRIGEVDLVVTGEGRMDRTSFLGKAPGAIIQLCAQAGTPVALVVGDLAPDVDPPVPTVCLVERFGRAAALQYTIECVESATAELLKNYLKPKAS